MVSGCGRSLNMATRFANTNDTIGCFKDVEEWHQLGVVEAMVHLLLKHYLRALHKHHTMALDWINSDPSTMPQTPV
jgi:hypothetical protein